MRARVARDGNGRASAACWPHSVRVLSFRATPSFLPKRRRLSNPRDPTRPSLELHPKLPTGVPAKMYRPPEPSAVPGPATSGLSGGETSALAQREASLPASGPLGWAGVQLSSGRLEPAPRWWWEGLEQGQARSASSGSRSEEVWPASGGWSRRAARRRAPSRRKNRGPG